MVGENFDRIISAAKRLIEERTRGYAQGCGIDSRRLEVGWYRKPGQLSNYPYILMVSTGGTPEQCAFSEQELASFIDGNKDAEARVRGLVNELKKNG